MTTKKQPNKERKEAEKEYIASVFYTDLSGKIQRGGFFLSKKFLHDNLWASAVGEEVVEIKITLKDKKSGI